jgi:hypothetical protein
MAFEGVGAIGEQRALAAPFPETVPWDIRIQSKLIARVFSIELALVVLTQKLAIPLGSKAQVAVALIIHVAAYGFLFAKGCLRIHPTRMLLFVAMMAAAFMFHARFNLDDFSLTSVLLVFVILSFYVFIIPIDREGYLSIVRTFILIGVVAAGLVWVDWASQIVGLGKPNLDKIIPYDFQYRDYNYMNRFWFGPIHYKPNGIVFLETSHASQFLATALVFEFIFFRRLRYLAILGVSLLGTFGGTGLTILLFCSPFIVKELKGTGLLGLAVAAPIAALIAFQIGFFDNALRRMDEFDKTNASGNIRFVMPVKAVAEAATGPFDTLLFGKGAGTMPRGSNHGLASFAWAPYAKVVVEYGLIVAMLWFALTCAGVFRPGIPFVISWSLFVQYHLLNGALAVPIHTIYCLLLAGAFLIIEPDEDAESPSIQPSL